MAVLRVCFSVALLLFVASRATAASGDVEWHTFPTSGGSLRAAVARPSGNGPFPTVVILHGTHGFAEEYVDLARDLARHGILSIAVCWFQGGRGVGQQFVTPLPCAGAPAFLDAPGLDRFVVSRHTLDELIGSIKSLEHVSATRLAMFGHSRGGGAALDYALSQPNVISALVLNSTGYPLEVTSRAAELELPVLILHGTADNAAEGGSPVTTIAMARRFENALKQNGVKVEAKYYDGAGHNAFFTDRAQHQDSVKRIGEFLQRVLAR